MTRLIPAGCAALLLSIGAAAHADTICAQGKVTSLTYRGYSFQSHDPSLTLIVNGKEVYVGMSRDADKSRMEISDFRATALAALLSGANVTISTPESSCPTYPDQTQVAITVSAPAPGD